MAFTKALYYPYIEIQDDAWLKTAMLYWDQIQTIVPSSYDEAFQREINRVFEDEGFLVRYIIDSDHISKIKVAESFLEVIGTTEASSVIDGTDGIQRLVGRMSRYEMMFPEKMLVQLAFELERRGFVVRGEDRLFIEPWVGNIYMTILAEHISEANQIGLVTESMRYHRIKMAAQLDGRLNLLGFKEDHPRWDGPDRERFHRNLAQGYLADLIISGVNISPDTPPEKIASFKHKHSDELARFREEVTRLTQLVNLEIEIQGIKQQMVDAYRNSVKPAVNDLRKAIKAARIRTSGNVLLNIAFLLIPIVASVGIAPSESVQAFINSPVPYMSFGLGAAGLALKERAYNIRKEDDMRNNPYAYVLSLEKGLR